MDKLILTMNNAGLEIEYHPKVNATLISKKKTIDYAVHVDMFDNVYSVFAYRNEMFYLFGATICALIDLGGSLRGTWNLYDVVPESMISRWEQDKIINNNI
ncbi:hypothetical protein SAMN05421823_10573 [Catalinimonas alkaloidigena]|uniref:Uncharacterized protein n=1 Tax=Catalinimonas alkaloidigena TaxID=1075417 RepID=A0A1G9IQN2_9BACT|nr:hypothetical protein [Catalinimonas alkaloidigena]SDL27365.1 hypothetical protein SAMN05421823_10573 [Catalinimonas alkaloidigena]